MLCVTQIFPFDSSQGRALGSLLHGDSTIARNEQISRAVVWDSNIKYSPLCVKASSEIIVPGIE